MIKLGIIGCGRHAQHHAEHLGSSAVIHGVWDPSEEAMSHIECAVKYHTLGALLADSAIEGVLICSPDNQHISQIEAAIYAHKHVFCEKPLLTPGDNIERLETILEVAKAHGLALTSCHPRRFDRPVIWLKKNMADLIERFGIVVSFDFDFSYHAPRNAWKHTRSLLLDHLNHEVDLMNFLFGVEGFRAWRRNDGFDHYDVVGQRAGGITFNFRGTRHLNEHVYPEWCRIRFERGEVVLDMMQGVATIHDHGNKKVETIENLSVDYDGRLRGVMTNFVEEQILGGKTGYLTPAEMLMNTEAGIILTGTNDDMKTIKSRS